MATTADFSWPQVRTSHGQKVRTFSWPRTPIPVAGPSISFGRLSLIVGRIPVCDTGPRRGRRGHAVFEWVQAPEIAGVRHSPALRGVWIRFRQIRRTTRVSCCIGLSGHLRIEGGSAAYVLQVALRVARRSELEHGLADQFGEVAR